MQVTLYILQTMGSSLYAPTEPRSAAPTDLMLNKLEQVSKSVKVSALCFSACVSVCLRIRINHLRTFSYIKIIGQKGLQYFNSKAYVRVLLILVYLSIGTIHIVIFKKPCTHYTWNAFSRLVSNFQVPRGTLGL